jgi:hypothetical protein
MQFKGSAGHKNRIYKGIWNLFKRILPPGSLGRRVFYQLRARYGRSIISLDRRPSLPIDDHLQQFLQTITDTHVPEVVVILTSTELRESEGQRSTNLAFEFVKRQIPSVFGYWRWNHDHWVEQDRLGDGILQIPVDVLASWPEMIFREIHAERKILLIEFPHPSFFKLIAEAHACGWIVIYDVVDDWEEFFRVGQAIWYDKVFERHLLKSADAIVAVNHFLAEQIRQVGAREVNVIPNGLSSGIESIDQSRDLDRGQVTVGYFGYLAGAWFDWELLSEAAGQLPGWKFYLIGYGGEPEKGRLPGNVFLLGKKPRNELASYAANWDVAIIPFKDERLARGADPIKTYEYLAMDLPVVVTGVHAPEGAEAYVRRAEGVESFIQSLKLAAGERDLAGNERKSFAQTCTWSKRVDAFSQMIETSSQRIGEKRALFGGGR